MINEPEQDNCSQAIPATVPIKGRFSGLTKENRERRAFDEMEKEADGYKDLIERLLECHEESSRDGRRRGLRCRNYFEARRGSRASQLGGDTEEALDKLRLPYRVPAV